MQNQTEILGIKNNQLFYQQDERTPLTRLSIYFHGAGEQQEDSQVSGVAKITAKMLFRGTKKYSRQEILKTFELFGADIKASVSETDFVIALSVFTRNLDKTLLFISEIISDVNFPEEELNLVKIQSKNKLESALQDSDTVLRAGNQYVIYNGSKIGKIGSVSKILEIKSIDLQNYFEKVKSCSKIYFTSISDLSKSEIEKKMEVFILGRNTNGFVLKEEEKYKIFNKPTAYIFNSENSSNDRLIWSHDGIQMNDEKRFALSLILDALGSFEGFLFDKLRNQKGWCYGVYASAITGTNHKGKITYYSDPSSKTSKDLIPELFYLIRTFQKEKDYLEKLKLRNETFKNRYAYQLDIKYKLVSEILFYRFGIKQLSKEEYYSKINEVTEETSLQVISELFKTENMAMVFYGDAERISKIIQHTVMNIEINILDPKILIE